MGGKYSFPTLIGSSVDQQLTLVKWMQVVLVQGKSIALTLPLSRLLHDSIEANCVLYGCLTRESRCVVIDKSDRPAALVNSLLDKIRVGERKRTGRKGEPYGSPARSSSSTADVCPLTTIMALRTGQRVPNLPNHATKPGAQRAASF